MAMRMFAAIVLCSTAALLAGGCGGKKERRGESASSSSRPDTVIVEGYLTGEGGRCAALRNDAGEVLALEEIPSPFDEWERFLDQRFMVVGEEVQSDRCGIDRTLRVLDMGLVLPPVIAPRLLNTRG